MKDKSNRFICLCNKVSQQKIEDSLARGCNTLPKIFSATTAGIGECGGSCRPKLEKMLDYYLKNKKFLDKP